MDSRRAIRGSYNLSFRYPLLYITGIVRSFFQKGVFQELRNEAKRSVKVVRGEWLVAEKYAKSSTDALVFPFSDFLE